MSKTILVAGYGPGISDAVARRFGKEGYQVALVARTAARLEQAARNLAHDGVTARAFPADVSDRVALHGAIRDVRDAFGPITAIHWNAYGGGAGDLLTAPEAELRAVFGISVTGLINAVQESLPDLEAAKGAVLVTGGGFAFYDAGVDAMATQFKSMGLAIGKAAQHKTVGLLRAALAPRGVYVGEVVVTGMVKGTAFDRGNATVEAKDVAQRFWELASERAEGSVTFG